MCMGIMIGALKYSLIWVKISTERMYEMELPHNNFDLTVKESLSLFKDKPLDFLGLEGIAPITEILGSESVEINVNWEFKDLVFGTSDGCGLNFEAESDLSEDDLYRFLGYNVGLRRMHKREFLTVVFVKNPTKLTGIKSRQLDFQPIIVQCSEIDADAMLARLKKAVEEEQPINELEAIYLPLFHSNIHTPTELFRESAKLARKMQADDRAKQKILALLITLCGKVVDLSQLDIVLEELKVMGNVLVEHLIGVGKERGIELGAERKQEETAKKMIAKGYDSLEIIEITGLSLERLKELRPVALSRSAPV